MTTPKKRKVDRDLPGMDFNEALERLIHTDPNELRESLVADMLKKDAEIQERIKAARQEIEDGARPRKGRFRL